jgi:hypothetical protein
VAITCCGVRYFWFSSSMSQWQGWTPTQPSRSPRLMAMVKSLTSQTSILTRNDLESYSSGGSSYTIALAVVPPRKSAGSIHRASRGPSLSEHLPPHAWPPTRCQFKRCLPHGNQMASREITFGNDPRQNKE